MSTPPWALRVAAAAERPPSPSFESSIGPTSTGLGESIKPVCREAPSGRRFEERVTTAAKRSSALSGAWHRCRYVALANVRSPIIDSGRIAVIGYSFVVTGGRNPMSAGAARCTADGVGLQTDCGWPVGQCVCGTQVGYFARLDIAGSVDIASKKVVAPARPNSDRTRPTVRSTTWLASSAVIDT